MGGPFLSNRVARSDRGRIAAGQCRSISELDRGDTKLRSRETTSQDNQDKSGFKTLATARHKYCSPLNAVVAIIE
jgi:hypothetical protein